MMILDEKDFVYEFTERTLSNYEKLKDKKTIYEVTLLINSAVGLLFIPKEQNDKIYKNFDNTELLKELQTSVEDNTYNGKIDDESFSEIVRHIRNSIAHGRFEFEAEKTPSNSEPNVVHSVKFEDIDYKDKTKKFKIILSIELLEKFMLEIANTILKKRK